MLLIDQECWQIYLLIDKEYWQIHHLMKTHLILSNIFFYFILHIAILGICQSASEQCPQSFTGYILSRSVGSGLHTTWLSIFIEGTWFSTENDFSGNQLFLQENLFNFLNSTTQIIMEVKKMSFSFYSYFTV